MSKNEKAEDFKKFEFLTFEDFKRRAKDNKMSCYEKIGFPDSYRKGYENLIFKDIKSKLGGLRGKNKVILDIGCGCSELASMMIKLCQKNASKLLLVDSDEMLSLLPNGSSIEKFPARFPDCPVLLEKYAGKVDSVLIYSVLQHVFLEDSLFVFLDTACELLKEGGEILIGDIPNISKRKRFFSSKSGIECHQKFSGTKEIPKIEYMVVETKKIDDGVVFGILQRYRNFGFDTYLLPQNDNLPIANRREDILIKKP
jgi:hypothetical protein